MSSPGPSVPALERALAILEALGNARAGLTSAQVARQLNLPKSSVHYLVQTLDRAGYIHREPGARTYRLSLRFCELASRALRGMGIRDEARPVLRMLCNSTGLVTHLGILEDGSAVIIEKMEPPQPVRVATWVGKRMSVHCTALGKALIAYLPEAQIDQLLISHPLLRHNENTIGSVQKLKEELALVRRRGYALDDEEEEIGWRCVGAPILGDDDLPLGAISVVGRTSSVDAENYPQLAQRVRDAARDIAARFTAPPHAA